MDYPEDVLKKMRYANSIGDTKGAVKFAERLIVQLPNSEEAGKAKAFLNSLGSAIVNQSSPTEISGSIQESNGNMRDKASVQTSYGTAKTVGLLLEGMGWILVGCGPSLLFVGFANPDQFTPLLTIVLSVSLVIIGLLEVAGGQIVRAVADTADNSRSILSEIRRSRVERED